MQRLLLSFAVALAASGFSAAALFAEQTETNTQPVPHIDLSGFPVLTGKVKVAAGHLSTFIPPKGGDAFRLDWNEVTSASKIEFDPERKSYIPLPKPLAVESVKYAGNGVFGSIRLVSRQEERSITLDVEPLPGNGPEYVRVWVMIESDVLEGVVMVDCRREGEFPARPQ